MQSDSKKRIIAMAINTGIVIVYYILTFLIIPNTPGLNFIEEDLDFILISLPIMIISVVIVICRKSFRVWVVPDIVFCVLYLRPRAKTSIRMEWVYSALVLHIKHMNEVARLSDQ